MLLEIESRFGKINIYESVVARILSNNIEGFQGQIHFSTITGKLLNTINDKKKEEHFFNIDLDKKELQVFVIFKFGISQKNIAEKFAKKTKENLKTIGMDISIINILSKGILIKNGILRREIDFTF
jgi:uncharacterized alkaline shock family protein YloU